MSHVARKSSYLLARPFHLPYLFYNVSRPIIPCCFLLHGSHPFAFSATVYATVQSKTGPYRTYGFLTDFPNTTSRYSHTLLVASWKSEFYCQYHRIRHLAQFNIAKFDMCNVTICAKDDAYALYERIYESCNTNKINF